MKERNEMCWNGKKQSREDGKSSATTLLVYNWGGPTGKTPPHLQTDGRRERTVMLSGQEYGKEKRRTGNGEEGKGNQGEPGEARLLPLASPGIVEMMMEKGQDKKGETHRKTGEKRT